MDPVSLLGLGIGAASLAFQLYAGCIKGFVLLSTAQDLGKDSSTMLCMLNLQEIQLTEWARQVGLLEDRPLLDRRLNETIVQAVLQALQSLLVDTDKLKSRYGIRLVAIPPSISRTADAAGSPLVRSILGHAISERTRTDILKRAQDGNHFSQRLRWAAVDKSKFEMYINDIRQFVQELWRLLDPIRQDEMSSKLQIILSHVIAMSGNPSDLTVLRETIEHSSAALASSSNSNPNSSLASAAEVRAVRYSIETDPDSEDIVISPLESHQNVLYTPSSANRARVTYLDKYLIHDYDPLKGSPDMGHAKYDNTPIFVEWKTIPPRSQDKILRRVQDLAVLLGAPKHPSFRSLQCIGIARDIDASKVAFVFRLPSSISQPPRTLRSLFGSHPSVTDRLQLALKITQSVQHFHTAGWLHKNLRSENILLFSPANATPFATSNLSNPVLAGFAFSRLDPPSEISEQPSFAPQYDIYRHPDAMGEPSVSFTAAKDIYSLGAILLEIGEWRSLKSLVERVVDVNKPDVLLSQISQVKAHLLEEGPRGGLATLKFRMGDVFTRVTRMMLSGEIPQSFRISQESDVVFTPDILDIAVRELRRCVI